MRYQNVRIHSLGHYLPEEYLSSEDIEGLLKPIYSRLKLPEGRLELQTGIKTRGVWPAGTRPSDLATKAAKDCLRESQIDKMQLDCLIHASVCRDFLEPATASVVHSNLELSGKTAFFDLSNACLGVLSSMSMAAQMIESGVWKSCLIVSGENSAPLLNETIKELNTNEAITRKSVKKYIANLTIGSAATAVLLTHKDIGDGHKLLSSTTRTDSSASKLCQGGGDTHSLMMETDSELLLKHGMKLASETWLAFKSELGWSDSDYQKVIGHQVGVAHRQGVLGALGIDLKKDFSSFEKLGNTGSSAVAVTLDLALRQNFIESGDRIAILGIGSGLACTMLGLECQI